MAVEKPPRELVEGVDYYIEAGRWVFTAAYHSARGSCCTSGCRHCPWGYAKPAESRSPPRGDPADSGREPGPTPPTRA